MKFYKIYLIFLIIIFSIIFICKSNDINEINDDYIIKVRVGDDIEEMPLEEYLIGVLYAEMPASFEVEALKAQAIAARTYALSRLENEYEEHKGADICTDFNHCQAWKKIDKDNEYYEKIYNAVNETKGIIITYNGKKIEPLYHANSGGKTENSYNVWNGKKEEYLMMVESLNEEEYDSFYSEKTFLYDELKDLLKTNCDINSIEIVELNDTGRVNKIKIGDNEYSGTEIRTLLNLNSTNFEIELGYDSVLFKVKGYGHGVGMSQCGANSMAKEGYNCEQIIEYYYKGVKLEKDTF